MSRDPEEAAAAESGAHTHEADGYDVVVIGAGPAGENAAWYAIDNGLSVAIVESELVGGECSYWACMPSKALLRAAEALAAARRVPGAREAITGELDVAAILDRRNDFAGNWDDQGQVDWLVGIGIELVRGHGRLAGEKTVEVTDADGGVRTLRAEKAVVVAPGSAAAFPPVPGLRESNPWGNREITAAATVPERLIVLGGGVVGVEMAQAWKSLGASEVTIVEMMDRLLPGHEPFVGEELAAALRDLGIDVITGVAAARVDRRGEGFVVELADGRVIEGDELVVAAGRRPLTDDLGLETIGLEPGGFLTVDDHMRVEGVEDGWLYAVGDVNGRSLVTHMGKYQARLVGDTIAGIESPAWSDLTAAPGVVFTDPQVASVGLTEARARDAGMNVRTVSYGTGAVAGAATLGQGVSGTSFLVIDEDRDVIVGATFTGPGVGEMVHAATIAIVGEVTIERLWHAVPAFPTVSEVWLRLLEEVRTARRQEAAVPA
ncbi:MAG TPA: NAD(P)/FAD-dependent oxidoreductase [Acidimicrobiales bacterium]|nr:NAD(P)/FAD-dependent oxidoreductase [Acidimicrobiales bacterium]